MKTFWRDSSPKELAIEQSAFSKDESKLTEIYSDLSEKGGEEWIMFPRITDKMRSDQWEWQKEFLQMWEQIKTKKGSRK